MEVQNKELLSTRIDTKEALKQGNIESALAGLGLETQQTIAFQADLNRVGLEIMANSYENTEFNQKMQDFFNTQLLSPQV